MNIRYEPESLSYGGKAPVHFRTPMQGTGYGGAKSCARCAGDRRNAKKCRYYGLHFDLYTVTPDAFPRAGRFRVLHDPGHLLAQFVAEMTGHSLAWEQAERCFNSFSFTMLEFNSAWCRGDITWSARLASHLAGDLGVVLRYRYDPSNVQLGTKRLESVLPVGVREQLRSALSFCCGDTIPHGVLMLAVLMHETMKHLETIGFHIQRVRANA